MAGALQQRNHPHEQPGQLLFLYGLALYLPPIRILFGKSKQGCNGDACEI